ncbi:MAG: GDSL-type esterase/lipase family protein [Ancalomicrobiaceae bacterium]|nr:GDSL-type esterase/lipase family protein [Ancalomicrobiaceae bacterium]
MDAIRALALGVILVCSAVAAGAVRAEPGSGLPPDCGVPSVAPNTVVTLPNVTAALRTRQRIVVLTIGASSIGGQPFSGMDYYSLVETYLERAFKGLDVVIVQRGVSGELARDAADRIKLETARAQPDVVFWQVGTADALAGLEPAEIAETVRDTVVWLRQHNVDTVLIGLHYSRALSDDPHYQAVRAALAEVAKSENIQRISRYEVVETLSKLHESVGNPDRETELTTESYACMAEYLARTLAAGLFGRHQLLPDAPP